MKIHHFLSWSIVKTDDLCDKLADAARQKKNYENTIKSLNAKVLDLNKLIESQNEMIDKYKYVGFLRDKKTGKFRRMRVK